MTDNSVKVNDIELYLHDIQYYADEYIATLDDKQLELLTSQNKGVFVGMLKYINNNYIKHHHIKYYDIQLLDNIWDLYTELCYKYNKRPTILNYCILTGINQDTIWDWKNGNSRCKAYYDSNDNLIQDISSWKMNHRGERYREEPSTTFSETVKKWFTDCEAALYDGATEQNSIGCIFALKANYGYTETAPIQTVNQNQRVLGVADLPKLGSELSDNLPEIVADEDG